jgi:hypothetical protein
VWQCTTAAAAAAAAATAAAADGSIAAVGRGGVGCAPGCCYCCLPVY